MLVCLTVPKMRIIYTWIPSPKQLPYYRWILLTHYWHIDFCSANNCNLFKVLLQSFKWPFIHPCVHMCLRQVVLDENSCPSIFIGMFWSHYWPALRLWSAMRYMLQSTLSLMWPLLLTHWQCNLTRLMTCSMTSLGEASRPQPHWGVWSGGGCVNCRIPHWPLWRTNQIGLWFKRSAFALCNFS